jgi:hypothetical protein
LSDDDLASRCSRELPVAAHPPARARFAPTARAAFPPEPGILPGREAANGFYLALPDRRRPWTACPALVAAKLFDYVGDPEGPSG